MSPSPPRVNPDLQAERDGASFDWRAVAAYLYGGKTTVDRREHLQALINQEPVFENPKPLAFMTRSERLENAARKTCAITDFILEHIDDPTNNFEELRWIQGAILNSEPHPFGLHYTMFLPAIQAQMSDEQQEKWLVPAMQRAINGTYAQTELGHGTFLRGLETTATYDESTREFILNSPTITSTKWWPGNLGKSTNYAIVMANLTTKGIKRGTHGFMVQLRDLETHMPLRGIDVGDIGPKIGYASNDNGYLRMDHVRVPFDQMLARHAKVLPNGDYVPPPHKKIGYGTMMFVRSVMVADQANLLNRAATIAIRYSTVRRQGLVESNKPEVKLLDYQSQQYRLFPQLATSFAYFIVGQEMRRKYVEIERQLKTGNVTELAELHALSSGIKAIHSWDVAQGIEQCRLSCGGHGYAHSSGIPEIYANAVGGCTYEGDNIVMLLQTARYLVKTARAINAGHDTARHSTITAYLTQTNTARRSPLNQSMDNAHVIMAYEHAARRTIFGVTAQLDKLVKSGTSSERAWVACQVALCKAARAHARIYVARSFVDSVAQITDVSIRPVMGRQCQLYIVHTLLRHAANVTVDGYMSEQQMALLQQKRVELLAAIRPDAVALVDSWMHQDRELQSCLGRYDGNVYEALMEWVKHSELNQTHITSAHEKYVGPLMAEARAKL